MSVTVLEVSRSGMQAAWQDLGRQGGGQHGVTEGGAMDIQASMWANRLLQRNVSEPLIEITLGLFEVIFKTNCQIALTGANLGACLDGQPITPWNSYNIPAGAELKFNTPVTGLRAYLAIDAQFDLQRYFDSVSTVARENLGGYRDRALQAGDVLSGIVNPTPVLQRKIPGRYIPDYAAPLTLDLIPGYQFDQFPKDSIDRLLNTEFQVQAGSSRMACILKGEPVRHEIQSLLSEGMAYGAVQIPPDGQPVILLNDRQTMGGYPKLGCIPHLSGSALAQRQAPAGIRFKLQTPEIARAEYREHLAFFGR